MEEHAIIGNNTSPGRAMIDSYPLEWEESLKQVLAMAWERLIPGPPAAGGVAGTRLRRSSPARDAGRTPDSG